MGTCRRSAMIRPALLPPPPSQQRPLSLSAIQVDQLGVLRQILSDLETSTSAGQVYLMGKVVGGLETELARRGRLLAEIERRRIRRHLDGLAQQASRLAPVPSRFIDDAEVVLGLLGSRRQQPV
jgi:hypothetical protein